MRMPRESLLTEQGALGSGRQLAESTDPNLNGQLIVESGPGSDLAQ